MQDKEGYWYSLRIRPYKTLENKIDGAVIMLVDIDTLKQSQNRLRRQAELLDQVYEPIFTWEVKGPIIIEGFRVAKKTHDDGTGLASNTLPHVFDLFMQSSRSLDRFQGGLGIGPVLSWEY